MYNLPEGVLNFAARAMIDVLPTPDNLKQWGIHSHESCEVCGSKGTQHHIQLLSCCFGTRQVHFQA
jgi:hypothetical protein